MSSRYCFGDFELDARRGSLLCGGREIDLGSRAFGVLKRLLESDGRVVSRQELLDDVWRDIAVTDDSLARAISDLRIALGDDPSHPRYIRTVHRQGYLFIAAVRRLADPKPSSDVAAQPPWRRLLVPFVLIAVLVVGAASATMILLRSRASNGAGATAPLPDFSTWRLRALGPSPFTSTAIKPAHGKTQALLAVVASDPESGVHSLFLIRANGGEPVQLTRNVEVRGPTPEFTWDDSHIMFTRYRTDPGIGLVPDVWRVPIAGGEPTLLVEYASAASTSPDGRGLVYAAVTPSGTSVRVRHPDNREVEVAEGGFWPRWSPDGAWIAYTTSDPEGGDGTLRVVRPDGSDHRELTTVPTQMYGLCWTPDSKHVIFSSERSGPSALWSVGLDGSGPIAVTRGPGLSSAPSMSPDGRRLVFDFGHRQWFLFLASDLGGEMHRVLEEPGLVAAALSPDGEKIAVALGTATQSPAVAVVDARNLGRRTLTGMTASAVAWTPDGESVLFSAAGLDGTGTWIWRVPIEGGLPEPIMQGREVLDAPAASPDGSRLAVVRRAPAGSALLVHHLETGHDLTLAEREVIGAPRWSPDGRFLVWSGSWRPEDLTSGGIWVCPTEGGTPWRLLADGAWPVWDATGDHVLFVRFLEHQGVWRVPVRGGPAHLIRRLEGEMKGLLLEGLDIGRGGGPLMLSLSRFTGGLYAFEPPPEG